MEWWKARENTFTVTKILGRWSIILRVFQRLWVEIPIVGLERRIPLTPQMGRIPWVVSPVDGLGRRGSWSFEYKLTSLLPYVSPLVGDPMGLTTGQGRTTQDTQTYTDKTLYTHGDTVVYVRLGLGGFVLLVFSLFYSTFVDCLSLFILHP